jgi:hypothetical protein
MFSSKSLGRHGVSGPRQLGLIECALALSVIVGFGFVTLRVMSMGGPATFNQAATDPAALVKAEVTPPAVEEPATKTP